MILSLYWKVIKKIMYKNLIKYKNYRYLNIALLFAIASIVLYFTQGLTQPANGGTWQGYVLGVFATVLILLLTYLGIRKRSYSSKLGNLEGWTSAHIFLGMLVLVLATLHAAFQVGWNIHTLAYVLMVFVVFSGFYGLYVYLHYPQVMHQNLANNTQQQWIDELQEIDNEIKQLTPSFTTKIRTVVMSALENTHLGGSMLTRLLGKDKSKVLSLETKKLVANKSQESIIEVLAKRIPNSIKQAEASALNKSLSLFSRRKRLLTILNRDVQIKAFLKVWLFIHIPMTIALLAALSVHILVVFIYW
jgi:hypothetical protein